MMNNFKNNYSRLTSIIKLSGLIAISTYATNVAADTNINKHKGTELVEIGASLNNKVDLELNEIPPEILKLVTELEPGFVLKEAEKELKHGNTYYDIEGEKADGSEIEFDLMQVENQWKVMEIQRDVTLVQCPPEVINTYHDNSSFKPERIIESKQMTGEVIYEFYTTLTNGKEVKHEIKFVDGKAEFLEKEWEH